MLVTKRFEIPVAYNINPLENEHILDEDDNSQGPIEEVITISIECDEMDFPDDCEELDELISRGDQYVGLYSAIIEALAEQHGFDPEQIELIDEPHECTPLDLEES